MLSLADTVCNVDTRGNVTLRAIDIGRPNLHAMFPSNT